MKKIIALTLALVLALGLVACGSKTDNTTITVAASSTPTLRSWQLPRKSWQRTAGP